MELNHIPLWGNSVQKWLLALGTGLSLFLILLAARTFFRRRFGNRKSAEPSFLNHCLNGVLPATRGWFLFGLSLYFSSRSLNLPSRAEVYSQHLLLLGLLIQLIHWGQAIITTLLRWNVAATDPRDAGRLTTLKALSFLARIALYTVVLLWGLDNFGVHITTLIAGLGIGGIAVALAVQNILGNLLSALTIFLDRPIQIGDRVLIGEVEGIVEKIGLSTTRIRAGLHEEIVIGNSDLLRSRVRNFSTHPDRKGAITLPLSPNTPLPDLQTIPQRLIQDVSRVADIHSVTAHYKRLTAQGIEIEVGFLSHSRDNGVVAAAQHEVTLAALKCLDQAQIRLASCPPPPLA